MKKVKRDYRSRKTKLRWKIALPLLVLALLLSYVLFTLMSPHEVIVKQPKYLVCDYSLQKAQTTLKTLVYEDTTILAQHLYYGETLNIYHDPFELAKTDYFVGKTLILRNVCDGTELVYMMENYVDRQIPLDTITEGFYEVFVMENLTKTRLISNNVLYDEFYTIRREIGLGMEVEVVADADLIESPFEERKIFDKNYVFIRVVKKEVPEAIYDVVIDPSRNQYEGDGLVVKNVNGANALVDSAKLLKTKLEAYGLKVFISRGNEMINRWGTDGRMARIYGVKAKYYIALDFNSSANGISKGARIIYSHYASNRFATTVFDAYMELDDLTIFGVGSKGNKLGIVSGGVLDNMDVNTDVRETGGLILNAGRYSDASKENASFAASNPYGLQAILLDLLFLSNTQDYQIYTTRHDELIENIALGFADYLQLKKVN
ncbi:MAG: N-acetylmuramoyl-L-alanine amidase [Erysipelotrichaceae bacterium]|nr:MAG: N-acetylmuramoyl-L-alanine [Erysipelotrichaceae bacterium]TXT19720.1 MAG: N-acetylmuramoyl-L-alanine amidase [Erysipelotrichaceae bacterium]